MKYKVNYTEMISAYSDIKSTRNYMERHAQKLDSIKTQLAKCTKLQSFQTNVEARAQAAAIIRKALDDTALCLDAVRNEYLEAEKKVNLLTVIIDWVKKLFGKKSNKREPDGGGCTVAVPIIIPVPLPIPKPPKPPPKPQPPKPPQPPPKPKTPNPPGKLTPEELEADLKMYREVHAIRDRYLSRWRAATTEAQKRAVLNAMLAELQAVMGTSANPEINFIRSNPVQFAGSYNPGTRTINIEMNHRLFNSPDALKVLLHEIRHAYQAEAAGVPPRVYNPNHQVSDQRAQQWRDYWSSEYFYDLQCKDARWFSGGI